MNLNKKTNVKDNNNNGRKHDDMIVKRLHKSLNKYQKKNKKKDISCSNTSSGEKLPEIKSDMKDDVTTVTTTTAATQASIPLDVTTNDQVSVETKLNLNPATSSSPPTTTTCSKPLDNDPKSKSLTEIAQEIRQRLQHNKPNACSSGQSSSLLSLSSKNQIEWTTIQALQELSRKHSLSSPSSTNDHSNNQATKTMNQPKGTSLEVEGDEDDYHSAVEDDDDDKELNCWSCGASFQTTFIQMERCTPMATVLTTTKYYEDISSMTSSSTFPPDYRNHSSSADWVKYDNNSWCWRFYRTMVIIIFVVYSYFAIKYSIVPIFLSSIYDTTAIQRIIIPSLCYDTVTKISNPFPSIFLDLRQLQNRLTNGFYIKSLANHETTIDISSSFWTYTMATSSLSIEQVTNETIFVSPSISSNHSSNIVKDYDPTFVLISAFTNNPTVPYKSDPLHSFKFVGNRNDGIPDILDINSNNTDNQSNITDNNEITDKVEDRRWCSSSSLWTKQFTENQSYVNHRLDKRQHMFKSKQIHKNLKDSDGRLIWKSMKRKRDPFDNQCWKEQQNGIPMQEASLSRTDMDLRPNFHTMQEKEDHLSYPMFPPSDLGVQVCNCRYPQDCLQMKKETNMVEPISSIKSNSQIGIAALEQQCNLHSITDDDTMIVAIRTQNKIVNTTRVVLDDVCPIDLTFSQKFPSSTISSVNDLEGVLQSISGHSQCNNCDDLIYQKLFSLHHKNKCFINSEWMHEIKNTSDNQSGYDINCNDVQNCDLTNHDKYDYDLVVPPILVLSSRKYFEKAIKTNPIDDTATTSNQSLSESYCCMDSFCNLHHSFLTTLFYSHIMTVTSTTTMFNPNYCSNIPSKRPSQINNSIPRFIAKGDIIKRKEKKMLYQTKAKFTASNLLPLIENDNDTAFGPFTNSWNTSKSSTTRKNERLESTKSVLLPVLSRNKQLLLPSHQQQEEKSNTTKTMNHLPSEKMFSDWDWTNYYSFVNMTCPRQTQSEIISAISSTLDFKDINNTHSMNNSNKEYYPNNITSTDHVINSTSSSKTRKVSMLNGQNDDGNNNDYDKGSNEDELSSLFHRDNTIESNIVPRKQRKSQFWKAFSSSSNPVVATRGPSFIFLPDKNHYKKIHGQGGGKNLQTTMEWKEILSDFIHNIRHDQDFPGIVEDDEEETASSLVDTDAKIRFFEIIDSILVRSKHTQLKTQRPEWMRANSEYEFSMNNSLMMKTARKFSNLSRKVQAVDDETTMHKKNNVLKIKSNIVGTP